MKNLIPLDHLSNFPENVTILSSNHFCQKNKHGNQLYQSNHFWIMCKLICQRAHQSKCEAISLQRFSIFLPNLVFVFTTMIWCHQFQYNATLCSGEKWLIVLIISERLGQKSQDLSLHFVFQSSMPSWMIFQIPNGHVCHFGHRPFKKKKKKKNYIYNECTGISLRNLVCVFATMPWSYSKSFLLRFTFDYFCLLSYDLSW